MEQFLDRPGGLADGLRLSPPITAVRLKEPNEHYQCRRRRCIDIACLLL